MINVSAVTFVDHAIDTVVFVTAFVVKPTGITHTPAVVNNADALYPLLTPRQTELT